MSISPRSRHWRRPRSPRRRGIRSPPSAVRSTATRWWQSPPGPAFSFSYAEHNELLRAAGADVGEFDPMSEPLPEGTAALVLPGGFPEQYPGELSANAVVRHQIRELARYAPIYAECAGLT